MHGFWKTKPWIFHRFCPQYLMWSRRVSRGTGIFLAEGLKDQLPHVAYGHTDTHHFCGGHQQKTTTKSGKHNFQFLLFRIPSIFWNLCLYVWRKHQKTNSGSMKHSTNFHPNSGSMDNFPPKNVTPTDIQSFSDQKNAMARPWVSFTRSSPPGRPVFQLDKPIQRQAVTVGSNSIWK